MKIIVTGGLGFIGSNFILSCLQKNNIEILNYDAVTYASDFTNVSSVSNNKRYQFVEGNICDSAKLSSVMSAFKPDAIINFAAESHVDNSITGPSAFIQTNVVGTQVLLAESLTYWKNLKSTKMKNFRFFHISTDEVYGSLEPEDPAFTELTRYDPSSPYSASKAASDHLVNAYHRTFGLPVLLSNCSNNYGPRQHDEKFIPTVINRMVHRQKIPVYGNGLQVRDWLHVSDHCDAIWAILKNGEVGEMFNIGGNAALKNLDVIEHIAYSMQQLKGGCQSSDYLDLIEHVDDRLGHDKRYAINSEKLQNHLKWSPIKSFSSGILSTVEWYLKFKYSV